MGNQRISGMLKFGRVCGVFDLVTWRILVLATYRSLSRRATVDVSFVLSYRCLLPVPLVMFVPPAAFFFINPAGKNPLALSTKSEKHTSGARRTCILQPLLRQTQSNHLCPDELGGYGIVDITLPCFCATSRLCRIVITAPQALPLCL